MKIFKIKLLLGLLLFNLSFSNDLINPVLTSYSISVTASDSSNYTLSGTDLNGSVSGDDPALTFIVGDAITFSVNASGHPFYIKTQAGTGTENQASGVTNNGAESGDVVWTPTATGTYYYQCSAHSDMVGTITIKAKVASIALDETTINEAGATSTLTATLSTAHSEDVIIPLTISGTASLKDYSTTFATSGVKTAAGGNDSGSALNQLNSPYDVFVDSDENIYVADAGNSRIVKWSPNATEGVAIISSVNAKRIFVDNSANIYVSSGSDVYKYTLSDGSYTQSTVAGGNGGGSALNQLNDPIGIDVDSSGNVYVADKNNHRIVKWAPDASEGVLVAGGNNNGNDLNQLNNPYDLKVDSDGNIYIADFNNSRIMKWSSGASEGSSVFGYVYYPNSIDIDSSGHFYVTQTWQARVFKYTELGQNSYTQLIGNGSNGSSSTQLHNPGGVHVDGSGNVYVADRSNNRIQKLQVNPEIKISSGDTTGTVTFSSLSDFDDEEDETIVITPSTSVNNAVSTITDASTITITDNDDPPSVSFALSFPSIDENSSSNVTLTATLSRVSGKSIQIPYTVGGTATETTEFTVSSSPITIPAGSTTGTVTISTNGLDDTDVEPIETIILTFGTLVNVTSTETDVTLNLLSDDKPTVDDIDINAVTIEENGSTSTITATLSAVHSRNVTIPLTITGTATLDQDYETEFSSKGPSILAGGNGSGNELNRLSNPLGVAVDDSGNIYVADNSNRRIVKWVPGAIKGEIIISGIYSWGIHVDSSGNIYAADHNNHRILKYTLSDGSYTPDVVAGGNGRGGNLDQLNYPTGIYVNASGHIYIADTNNHRVVKWEGGSEGLVVAGDNGNGSALNQLNSPYDVALDSSGNIYVSDSSNNRIMKWLPSSTEGTNILDGLYSINRPYDLEIDASDNIYLAGYGDYKVLKYTPVNGSYSQSIVAGNGGRGTDLNNLRPTGIFVDSNSNVYVSDNYQNRIIKQQIKPEIEIVAGSITGAIKFRSLADLSDEDDETIIVTPSTTVSNATSSLNDAKTITITDDDVASTVSFAFSSPSIDEDSSNDVTLTATLNEPSGREIKIPYTVGGTATETTEFTVSTSPIIIPAGSTTGTVTISTNGLDDTDVEPIETIILTFGTLVSATTTETDVTLNLLSDDKPTVDAVSLDTETIAEDGSTSTITATISAVHSRDVKIPLVLTGTAQKDSDYSIEFASRGASTVAGGNGEGNSLNQLRYPRGVVVDSSDNIYIADTDNNRIMKWDPGATKGEIIISGVNARAIHVDNSGNIFVSDHYNHRILKYTLSDGSYTQDVVAGGNGQGNSLNQLSYPWGIYVDSSETVYVADSYNHRIMKWLSGASQGVLVAGGNNEGNALNQLRYPRSVNVDSSGNIYVSDSDNNRIVKWAPNSNQGVDLFGYVHQPREIKFDSQQNLFVVMHYNQNIRKYSFFNGTYSNSSYSDLSSDFNNGNINYPNGIYIDQFDNIYVADRQNQRIEKLQLSPEIIVPAGSTTGTASFKSILDSSDEDDETIIVTPNTSVSNATSAITDASTITITDDDDAPTISFALSSPNIDEDSSNDVTLTATLNIVSGKSIEIPYTVGGTATKSTEFTVSSSPITIPLGSTTGTATISTNGLDDADVEPIETIILTFGTLVNATTTETDVTLNLLSDDKPTVDSFSLDTGSIEENNGVSTLTATLNAIHSKDVTIPLTISGTATNDVDYITNYIDKGLDETVAGGNNRGNSLNQLRYPRALAVDASGNIYVADSDNYRIMKWAPGASEGVSIITGIYPTGIHVDSSGNIYVSDHNNYRILKYTLSDGSYTPSVVAGGNGYGNNLNQLAYPWGIHVDDSETIYISDKDNHRIMKWQKGVSQGVVVAGGNGQGNSLNQLNNVYDVTVDENGNIFVPDESNHRVMKWIPNATEGVIVAGGNYGNGTNELRYPRGIELNSDGVLFISDSENNRIVKWNQGAAQGEVVAGKNGQGNNLNQLNNTYGVVSYAGSLYIADRNNHRIQKVDLNSKIVIKAGSLSSEIKFTSINDSSYEYDETIIVTPSTSPFNATSSYSDPYTITIVDGSEPPTLTFSLSSPYINEDSPTDVVLTASMPSVAGKPIEIPFTLSGTATETTEFTLSSNTINIAEGSNKGSISISTKGLDDTTVEPVETIIFTYGTIVNANSNETDITLNLLSDDNPTLNSIEYSKTSFAEHESVKITANLSEVHSKDVTIPVALSGTGIVDSDYSVDFENKGLAKILAGGLSGQGSDSNQLFYPRDVVMDSSGNMYIADFQNRRVMKWAPDAIEGEIIYSGAYAWGIDVDQNDNIYFSDLYNHRIYKLSLVDGSYNSTVVVGNSGQGSNLNQLSYPYGIKIDDSDNIYIADSHNHRIIKWAPGAITGVVVAGGNGEGNSLNKLSYPYDVSVDGSKNVYIADHNNRRVMKWTADAVEGIIVSEYDGYPMALEVDSSESIYVAYNGEDRVNRYTFKNNNYVKSLIAGNNGRGSDLNQLNEPHGLYLNSGDLLIADGSNHRILKIQLNPSIFIKAGLTTGDFTITGVEDRVDEGDETIIVTPSLSATNVVTEINDATTLSLLDNTISLVQKDDPFLGLSKSSVSWGDFDNDGDKDVAIMGVSNVDGAFNDIYRNNEGSFARMNQNFVNLYDGDLSWVDLNKDGYLDLVVSGYNETPQINVYISKNNAQFFERSENTYGLPELFASKMAWGDLDNDGDIDLAISGIDSENNNVFHVYYRENGKDNFVRETQFNSSVASNGFLEIVDIDLDGDNDIQSPGNTYINTYFRSQNNSYYNGGGGNKNSSLAFFKISGSERLDYIQMGEDDNGNINSNANNWGIDLKLKNGDIAIGDYDNNGFDDVVFTGENENGVPVTKLFEGISNGYGGFNWVESSIELVGLRESTADWVDYDMDGDLDLFITGLDSSSARTILYETEITNKDNQAPPKVTGLKAEDLGNGKIRFSWDTPSDDFSNNIGYVLRLGTTPGGTELSNTFSNLETGNRLITLPPPIYSNSYETSLEPGTYYFAVQAIDGGLKAGEFSEESSYTLKYEWKLLNQGGIVDRKIQSYENPVMKVGDIDNDNDLDLIYGTNANNNYGSETKVYTYNGVRLVEEDGNGYAQSIRNSRNITDIDIDDINSDGLSDVVINSFGSTSNNQLHVYFGSETGNMEQRGIGSGLYKGKVKIIDMNNDGQSEVVLIGLTADNTSGKPKIYIYEMNSDRSFVKVDISEQIDDLTGASYDLGDVDNDQDIDILISGFDESQGLKAYIYKNVGDAGLDYKLEKTTNNIAAIRDGTVDFIDFDSDGDLDAAVTGTGLQGDIFEIYKNDLNEGKENWPRIDLGLTGMRNGKTDLGDFNGDGFTDIIYSGLLEGAGKVTKLAEYTSASNSYVDSAFDVSDVIEASVEFGDIDGDGDLDFILSGEDKDGLSNNYDPWNNSKYIFRAYLNKRNESAAVPEPQSGSRRGASNSDSYVENAPPSVPEIISTKILLSEQTTEGNLVIEFSWNPSSDDLTPVEGLTYALKIGTTENGEEIMSANSNPNGQRKTAEKGNVEHNLKWKVSLPDGVYYWSVQAIDASYNGSEFSKPRQFLASSDFKLGDSNGDKSVNILDLTNIIDKILDNDVSVWIQTTSDINNDGVIDVLDVSGVINLILNSNQAGLAYGVDPGRNLNYFSTVPVGEIELVYSGNKVYFETKEVISGLQFSINKSIDHLINNEIKENLNIVNYEKDGKITYVIYSNENKSIADYSTILINYVDKKLKDYEISDIKAATPNGLPLNTHYKDESFFDEENDVLKVYPNPAKNNLNILGSIENDLNIVDVKIYNTIGVMVYEQSFDSIDRFRELDLSNLISGVYVIKINSSIGKNIKKTQVYKFIKN